METTVASSHQILREWDASHSWHPFSQMQEYLRLPPLHVESGQGVWLTDTEGGNEGVKRLI
jgi:adenosylmethionine-8-amino-7-oxononanoate aminotransferase